MSHDIDDEFCSHLYLLPLLQPVSKDQIMQIIEKAKENLPAKQPKKAAAAPAKVVKGGGGKASSAPAYVEEDEPPARSVKEKSAEPAGKAPTKGPGKTKATAVSSPVCWPHVGKVG